MWWRKNADPRRLVLRCSFCNKPQDDVPKLIAGPQVFICNECVEVCNDIIEDDERFETRAGKKDPQPTGDSPAPWPNTILCALCRVPISVVEGVILAGNRGILCARCVNAVQAVSASASKDSH